MSNKDTFWFPHDCDAADDDKTMLLIDQLGLEGYGIYWILIEKLRNRNDFKMPFSCIPTLARRYVTTAEKMKAVITQYGLFEYDEDGFFFSMSLINRMQGWIEQKNKRSLAGKKGNEIRWGNKYIANVSQCDCNAIAMQSDSIARTVQYSTVQNSTEENKFSFKQSLIDLGVDKDIVEDWIKVRKLKKAANTQTAFNAIRNQLAQCSISPTQCITIAVERSWSGFKAEWIENIKKQEPTLFNDNDTNKPNKVIIGGIEYR